MIKTLNLKFTEEEHNSLKSHKQDLKKALNLTRLSWEKYFKLLSKEVLVWDSLEVDKPLSNPLVDREIQINNKLIP